MKSNPHKNRKIIRAQWWDYSNAAAYFITICTKNRAHYFGEIKSKKMILSPMGIAADILWNEIKNHAKNAELGEYVIMPNHVHGILILNGDGMDRAKACLGPADPTTDPKKTENSPGKSRFRNQGKNTVSSIIGSYKSAVTRHLRRLEFDFGWQTRFHDHIVRNEAEHQRIANYIRNNPANWKEDSFF